MNEPRSRTRPGGGRTSATPRDLAELKERQAHRAEKHQDAGQQGSGRHAAPRGRGGDRGGRHGPAEKGVAPDGGIPGGRPPDEP
ncbi:hypothetical protein [Streptomyces roseicoloratus]|uniref:hypothetical protein n=1 Tax=Streptomyces roseicoloratus TaxID=2508722 RepID=UPI001009E8B0|nr:hypothetical protein [Streptomyces roseicoloratus]